MNKFIYVFSLLVFFACKKEVIEPLTIVGVNYFPIEVGSWIEYSVVSMVDVSTHDTARYVLREEITQMLDSSEFEVNYHVQRMIKYQDDVSWQDFDAVLLTVLPSGIVRQEANIAMLKLSNPLHLHSTWNANAYNANPDTILYSVVEEFGIDTIHGVAFDSVLVVEKEHFDNYVSVDEVVEKYVPGIGLVYQEIISVSSNDVQVNIPVLDRVDSGTMYYQTYKAHGKK